MQKLATPRRLDQGFFRPRFGCEGSKAGAGRGGQIFSLSGCPSASGKSSLSHDR